MTVIVLVFLGIFRSMIIVFLKITMQLLFMREIEYLLSNFIIGDVWI